jgi:hypothetical protein
MEERANMVVLSPADNVGVATRDIAAKAMARALGGTALEALEDIPLGHKIALTEIAARAPVLRFGVPVAVATRAIPRGALVHVHNVKSRYLDNDEDHYE